MIKVTANAVTLSALNHEVTFRYFFIFRTKPVFQLSGRSLWLDKQTRPIMLFIGMFSRKQF